MKRLLAILLFTGASAASAAFVPGPIQVNNGAGTATSVGYATGNSSVPVSILGGSVSSTQSGVFQVEPGTNTFRTAIENTPPVSQSGTWTMQPGNTPNTVGWFVDYSTGVQANLAVQASGGAKTNVGYQTGGSSVPVNVLNTLTINSPAVTQSGVFQVEPGTNTFKVSGPVTGTVTANQGTANVVPWLVTMTTNAVTQSGVFQVEPGTNTFRAAIQNIPAVSQSGTWTVQPGGTANTIPWLVTMTTNAVTGTLSDNGSAATNNRVGAVAGIYQNNLLNGTAATQGRDAALSVGTDGLLWTAQIPSLRPAGFMASTGTIASAASATDISCLQGNANNTVLVTGLRVSGTQTTAGNVHMSVIKRSTAYTGAWSTMTVVADDSTMNVGVSSAAWFQANPTVGTSVGVVDDYDLGVMASATATPNDIYVSPSIWRTRPIVLRGAAQGLCVNLNATTVTGGSFTVGWTWYEVSTITP